MRYDLLFYVLISFVLSGCYYTSDHHGFENYMDDQVGTKTSVNMQKNPKAGKLIRADYLIAGEGVTRIESDEDGNIVIHVYADEIIPTYPDKQWVGKCLIYYVVDSETNILLEWGYDEGGNPQSCRFW